MKERPILFSAPMVRAILDGRKTMTRRVIKDNCPFVTGAYFDEETERWYWTTGAERERLPTDLCLGKCPHGQPGDQLWVRETWMPFTEQGCPVGATIYRATDHPEPDGDSPLRWNPPIFMPKSASRITLEITAVRVERVQDISEKDAKAEGCGGYVGGEGPMSESVLAIEPGYNHPNFFRDGFAYLWDSLNAKRDYGWDANPWVWVLSFKRVKGGE